jgi:hypothetical protein
MSVADRPNRRTLLKGGTLTGIGALAALSGIAPNLAQAGVNGGRAWGATNPALTYLTIDGLAFVTYRVTSAPYVLYQHATGVQPSDAPNPLAAPLLLPVGSIVHQIAAVYIGTPIFQISRRSLATGAGTEPVALFQHSLAAGTNPASETINLPTPIVIDADGSYIMNPFFSVGQSLFAVRIGYLPPTRGFVPFAGTNARVFDSRKTGGKLSAGATRTVAMGMPGARSAVFKLNAVSAAERGFLAAYKPSSNADSKIPAVHFGPKSPAGGLVVCNLDADGELKIRANGSSTHAYIDCVGYLV